MGPLQRWGQGPSRWRCQLAAGYGAWSSGGSDPGAPGQATSPSRAAESSGPQRYAPSSCLLQMSSRAAPSLSQLPGDPTPGSKRFLEPVAVAIEGWASAGNQREQLGASPASAWPCHPGLKQAPESDHQVMVKVSMCPLAPLPPQPDPGGACLPVMTWLHFKHHSQDHLGHSRSLKRPQSLPCHL